MNKFIHPLTTSSWDEKELQAINEVVNTGLFTMGSKVSEFENNFSNYFNSKFAVMVNSGSSANLLMLSSLFYTKNKNLKLKIGDEVIVPAVSWSTTYAPLLQLGLKLKFVDIDINTLNFDLEALSNSISEKTRVVFAVNLLGNSNDFDAIKNIIENKNIILLEDNCESLGAKYNNKYTGTFGLMGTFSTFYSHHICTMEGGVILTDDEELYHILISLRAHGWTRNLPKNNKVFNKSNNEFNESFNFILPGYNMRPLEISGAIGIEQVRKIDNIIYQRRKNAKLFQSLFNNNSKIIIQKEIGESSWFGFSIIIREDDPLKRQSLLQLLKDNGFETRPIVAGNFTKNPVMKYFNYEIHSELKNADHLHFNGFFIGNHSYCLKNNFEILTSLIGI